MQKMDVQTKDLQEQIEAKEKELEKLSQTQIQAQKDKNASEQQAAEELEQTRQTARRTLQDSLVEEKQNKLKKGKEEFQESRKKATAELEEEIKRQKADLEGQLREELQTSQLPAQVAAAQATDDESEEGQARKDVERLSDALVKTENKLAEMEAELKNMRKSCDTSDSSTSHVSMNDMVQSLLAENRRKAAEAHSDLFGIYNTVPPDDDLPRAQTSNVISDLEQQRDPKEKRTHAEWADLTRQVQGLSTALYSEPSEAPYYDQTAQRHTDLEAIIMEYVRDHQIRMNKHFTELAEEYEYRRQLYEQSLQQRNLAIPEKARRPASALIPRQTNMMILESGGSRAPQGPPTSVTAAATTTATTASSNPYRRARRNNEVRSEYEQEQVIAELAAKEAMEKKVS
jgi:hypothetical protein